MTQSTHYLVTFMIYQKYLYLTIQLTITLIYLQNLYVNTTNYNNIDILINLIYCTHTYTRTWYITHTYTHVHAHTCVHVRTRIYTYIYILNTYKLNTYTFYQYILCKNCTKIHLNYLKYHFYFNTLIICVSLTYNT